MAGYPAEFSTGIAVIIYFEKVKSDNELNTVFVEGGNSNNSNNNNNNSRVNNDDNIKPY
jgi:hypothetical protein